MGELFAEIGDLVFTIVIGYISAIEFLYVVRHLYHYSCNHDASVGVDSNENLTQLQDSMRQQLANAKRKEALAGTQVMKDGVPYKDGFRLEEQQALIDHLKELLKNKELSDLKRQELEKELAKQTKIAEKLRKDLAEAEAKYQRQLKQEEEAKAKQLLEEQRQREQEEYAKREAEERRKREEEERNRKEAERKLREEQERREAEEQARKLAEAEKQREAEQRQREEAEANARRLQELEKQKEIEQREREEKLKEEARKQQEIAEAEENTQKLLEIEKVNEAKQAAEEAAAELATRTLLAIEHQLEEQLRAAEREAELTDKEHQLIEAIKKSDLPDDESNDHREAELLRKILKAREQLGEESEEEQSLRLIQRERDQEAKQKRIEENALLFLEAEKEMADLQSKMLDAVEKKVFRSSLDSAPQTPVIEEPCIKRSFAPLTGDESTHTTVKTQLAQDFDEPYTVRTKPLLFPGVSDDASSIDPASSQKSSFSTQPSEEITTGPDSQYPPLERQEPDGEDNNLIQQQYSDDYLRSLDGINQRPLVREDGSGRRRAFKKRRSSNSSNSSRESRQSRDEELKMFTSLEEEEMKDTADSEFTPIRYSTDPTLKVKGHHRRHKRSPAKDMRRGDDSLRSSLERLGEETSDPWGEVKPEHYKHTEFWKREKTLSIDEENEFERPISSEETAYNTATNVPSASSFEEANQKQNQEAMSALQKQSTHRNNQGGKSDEQAIVKEDSARSGNTNLQTTISSEHALSGHSSTSPHLRLSPRKEEENKSTPSTAQNTPTINVQTPLDYGPWRDEYGLVMEGLSDFYDFSASVNPSRSRSASRNVSPANTAPNTPLPKNVSFRMNLANEKVTENKTVEIYDDAENNTENEFRKENIVKFIDSLSGKEQQVENDKEVNDTSETEVEISKHLKHIADDPSSPSQDASLVPLVNIIQDSADGESPNLENTETFAMGTNTLVSSLRSQQSHGSRSRSKSPLPTADNLKRSVENRRYKMIKHNEDILEKLIESKLLPELTPPEEEEEKQTSTTAGDTTPQEDANPSIQSLLVDKRRSRSKSPMRLPTPENLSKGLEKRRNKLIERNDEFIKQLEERSQTPETPIVVVEHVYEIQSTAEDTHSFEQTETTSTSTNVVENEEDYTKEEMDMLVQSLRVARSRTRSKSPFSMQQVENTNEARTYYYGLHNAEYIETTHYSEATTVPTISIDFSETQDQAESSTETDKQEDFSKDNMDLLVQSLRAARSRSTSREPTDANLMLHMTERGKTPEPFAVSAIERSRHSRSKSPSRSHSASPDPNALCRSNTPSRSISPHSDDYESYDTIATIGAEELESFELSSQQRQLDEDALEKLRNASEEIELRTLNTLVLESDELNEEQDQDHLADLPLRERVKLLKKSPTTPDYDRTISEEVRDNERIKQEMLQKGFKRSTYVGESMDLGSEFEPLRKEAAKFKRSRSPSPSFSAIENATAQRNAEEKRKIQEIILQELASGSTVEQKEYKSTGAIPKAERYSSAEMEFSPNSDTDENASGIFQRLSPHSDGTTDNFEEMRRRNAEFRRSASTSRSPLREDQKEELANIEIEAAKRVLKDKMLDEVSSSSFKIQDISLTLNTKDFNNDRRASDSALSKVPDILIQLKDDEDIEPEEYHHFRRFSLAQEEPEEQYPGDDYIFIQQVEVRTRSGSRTWLREDFYSENVEDFLKRADRSARSSMEKDSVETSPNREQQGGENNVEEAAAGDEEEDYSNASDDDRQTVVEVDDEIDEDISDFNERGPAEESHHEISECEEAEREADRYAGREASDWNRVVENDDMQNANRSINFEEDEGAVGGFSSSPYDSDSFAIDQIYDEAIKNRKQSGILREYDNILRQMSSSSDIDEQYLLWSKTNAKKTPKNIEFNTQFLDNERKESEMRYLGDANTTARQSARLHSRYGYKPILQTKCLEEDVEVDLNYKPKKEYNWRKNFKLDDEAVKEDKEISMEEFYAQKEKYESVIEQQWEELKNNDELQQLDVDKTNLEEQNATLFKCSPEKIASLAEEAIEEHRDLKNEIFAKEEIKEEKQDTCEKPKKKKTKKKSHKESKASLEESMNREDEEAYDNQVFSRRSSSIQMETDSPKRKSRSRRSSRSSLANEDASGLFSPRSSIAANENIEDIMEEYTEVVKETSRPKKMKKRKKVKEVMANVAESPIESRQEASYNLVELNDLPPVSAAITPESSSANILSMLSPQNSVCITPASIESDINLSMEELLQTTTNSSTATEATTTTDSSPSVNLSRTSSLTTTMSVDTFDILKDASFYPLF